MREQYASIIGKRIDGKSDVINMVDHFGKLYAEDQIVGFTLASNKSNGLPIPFAYPAQNAVEIMRHFSIENPISTYLNVVMAQHLASNFPAFCVLVYGSDNKYDANDVKNQWTHIVNELAALNIEVLSISSDSTAIIKIGFAVESHTIEVVFFWKMETIFFHSRYYSHHYKVEELLTSYKLESPVVTIWTK